MPDSVTFQFSHWESSVSFDFLVVWYLVSMVSFGFSTVCLVSGFPWSPVGFPFVSLINDSDDPNTGVSGG